MPTGENPFLLPPPPPPERKGALGVILALSAIAHVLLFACALFSRTAPEASPARAGATVRLLRGEVTTDSGEPGLRLLGYAEVPAPANAAR